VIPPAAVKLNPSRDSDWATRLFEFVEDASQRGRTVTVLAEERVFSPQDAARSAHVSRMTIQRRIEDGTIHATKKGSRWLIPESEVDRYRLDLMRQAVALVADELEF